jgi:hypothetical protein
MSSVAAMSRLRRRPLKQFPSVIEGHDPRGCRAWCCGYAVRRKPELRRDGKVHHMSTLKIVGVWIAVLMFIGIGLGGLALTGDEQQTSTVTIEHAVIPPFRG